MAKSMTVPPSSRPRDEEATPRSPLSTLALVMLLASLGTSIANVGLPAFADAFAASFQEVQWVVLAYLGAMTALVVGAGALADRVGARPMLIGGVSLFVAGSALGAFAPVLWLLVAARFVQGAGAAAMMATVMPLAARLASPDCRGGAMGLLGSASAFGTAAGPVVGGVLLGVFDWRALFLATVVLGLGTLVAVALRVAPETRGGQARAEEGQRVPLHELLRDAPLRAAFAASLLAMTVMMATLVVGPFHLARGIGLGPADVGFAMAAGPIAAAVAGVPAGRLVDRFGAAPMTRAGLAAMGFGAILIALLASEGVTAYVLSLVVLTAGYALFQAANNSAVMEQAGPRNRGAASGLLQLSRNLGLIAGVAAMGALFAFASQGAVGGSPELVAVGTRTTFLAAALLLAAALAFLKIVPSQGLPGTSPLRAGGEGAK